MSWCRSRVIRLNIMSVTHVMCVMSFLFVKTTVADRPAQDRGLVVLDPLWRDIVREEKRHCLQCVSTRNFHGAVLGYITPVSDTPVSETQIYFMRLSFFIILPLLRLSGTLMDTTLRSCLVPSWRLCLQCGSSWDEEDRRVSTSPDCMTTTPVRTFLQLF